MSECLVLSAGLRKRLVSSGCLEDNPADESWLVAIGILFEGTHLAFDPTPMVSHLTQPPFWGRVECEKVAVLAAKTKGPGDDDDHDDDDGDDGDDDDDDDGGS